MQGTKKRVSDVISHKDIESWHNGDAVTISAGTGAGKSYFIKNILYAKAKSEHKKILMLVHRAKCSNQFEIEIEADDKSDIIDIKTYQSIEYSLINGYEISLDSYAYIVSDEFHYFIEDSGFNCYTDISFNAIIKCKYAVKIFMSATGETMLTMINKYVSKKNMHTYSISPEYSHLSSLAFFYQNNTIQALAYKLKAQGKKAIFFIQSAADAHNLYKEFMDCSIFLCGKSSKNGKKYYKDVDEDKITQMLTNQKFEELFLITTSCFDAGANIIDTDLHTVVIDMKNVSSLIQCLGRKRSQGVYDKLDVYIKAISNHQIGGMRSKRIDGLKQADYLLQHNTREYVEKYSRSKGFDKFHTSLIYDEPMSKRNINTCTKLVNDMIYEKYKLDISQYDEMLKIGYVNYIANILHFGYGYKRSYFMYDEGDLNSYLDLLAINGTVMLTAEDKKSFIEKMNVKHDGHLLKSRNSLNAALLEKKYNYKIDEFETSRMIDGNKKKFKSAWRIIKIN